MKDRPNILFIFPDQLRVDALGCYGNKAAITPNIDSLAAEATRFTQCYSTNPVCLPARSSIITGKYCHQTHCHSNASVLAPSEVCWPALIRDSGYFTALVGKLHLWEQYRSPSFTTVDHGFQYKQMVEGKASVGNGVEESGWYFEYLADRGLPLPHNWNADKECARWGNARISEYEPMDHIDGFIGTRAVRQILEGRKLAKKKGKPWLMQVGICSPHDAFDPPQAFFDMFDHVDIPDPVFNPAHNLTKSPAFQSYVSSCAKRVGFDLSGYDEESLERIRFMRRCYYANVSFVDHQVGRLIQALKDSGQYENTAIIFMSDHGDFLGNRGGIQKHYFLYQDNLHVPLLIRAPMVSGTPAVVNGLVQNIDLFATTLELAGIDLPQPTPSCSLLPMLRDATMTVRDAAFAECFDRKMIRSGRWKLITEEDPMGLELYDIESDPGETTNLARDPRNPDQPNQNPEHLAVIGQLLRRMVQWQFECEGTPKQF